MTGVGKTSFIKELTGLDMKVGHDLDSCTYSVTHRSPSSTQNRNKLIRVVGLGTKEIHLATTEIDGYVVRFIDTPGFDDDEVSDTDILTEISTYLSGTNTENLRLSGILYLHRITDKRVSGTALRNLSMFEKLVGKHNMGNVILLTTMWGNLPPSEDGETRVTDLTGKGKFWGGMIAAGAKHERYHRTKADAYRIVRLMLKNRPVTLQIQEELARGTKLVDTAAGKEVSERLEEMQAKHAREIEDLKEQLQLVSRRKNDELLEEIKALYDKLQSEQNQAAEARNRLYETQIESLRGQLAELEHKPKCIIC